MSTPSRPLYVAVEGAIGVGKTTLVNRLAQALGARIVLEAFEDNPFLTKFYEDRDRYAFQTQLFFLMSRFKQQQGLLQPDLFQPDLLSDYHLLKDRIFAQLTLADDELALYERVYSSLENQIMRPDVVVYLYAPLDTLLERIERRGRPYEKDFDAGYLLSLSRAYHRFFSHYSATPLLKVDNTTLDYSKQGGDSDAIIGRIVSDIRRMAQAPSHPSHLEAS